MTKSDQKTTPTGPEFQRIYDAMKRHRESVEELINRISVYANNLKSIPERKMDPTTEEKRDGTGIVPLLWDEISKTDQQYRGLAMISDHLQELIGS